MNDKTDTDVIVVGTGPTGSTAALALATYGVRVHVINRWNWVANTPRAHVINQRANEVFRDLAVEDQILERATPWELIGDTTFSTGLTGTEVARLRTWGTADSRRSDYLSGSPCPIVDLGQPEVESILVEAAAARGAQFSFNTEYCGHEEDDEGVTVRLRDSLSGHEWTRRAKYLIGADGAKSKIAQEIGLEIVGEHARAGQIYARFNADLSHLVAHRPAVLHYVLQPALGYGEMGLGVLRAVRPWDQWMAGWGFDMSAGAPDLDHDRALEQIRTMVGVPDLETEIEWVSPWYVNQARATTYGRGRVYCAGDAVHRHPPSSGLGSNTCVQDSFNLAWKLAYVIQGWAGAGLLDSYTTERAPVGEQIVARANQSRFDYAPLRAAFAAEGPDPVAAGVARLTAPTSEGAAARAALVKALDLKNFEFNAQGVELNQRYVSNAVLPDSSQAGSEERWERDPQLHLQATTLPGAKLPHVWLTREDGRRKSTLDVVGHGRFSLVTGLSGTAWKTAVDSLDLPFLSLVTIGDQGAQDLYGDWARIREIEEAGALLVRPDGYVAWRHSADVYDSAEAQTLLASALDNVLDNSAGSLPHKARKASEGSTPKLQPIFLDATQLNGVPS